MNMVHPEDCYGIYILSVPAVQHIKKKVGFSNNNLEAFGEMAVSRGGAGTHGMSLQHLVPGGKKVLKEQRGHGEREQAPTARGSFRPDLKLFEQ